MTVLLLLMTDSNNNDYNGRLAQIDTGEGKTTIISILAAYKALMGH